MSEPLLTVADRFAVPHGLLLVPGPGALGRDFRIGDPLVIVRPGGTRLRSPAYTADFIHGPPPGSNPFLVLTARTEADVPVGSEVWLATDLAAADSGG